MPRDHRRFDRLFWGPGGVYDDYHAQRLEGSVGDLQFTKYHRFISRGHRWGLAFSVWFLPKNLQAAVSLYPEPLLSRNQTDRVEATGFYDTFAAFFGLMGYGRGWVTPRGNVQYTRILSAMSEAGPLLAQFLDLGLGKKDPRPAPESTPGDPRKRFEEFL